MNREVVLDLILKAAAVYLFVLAVMALPDAVSALFGMSMYWPATLRTLGGEATLGDRFLTPNFILAAIGGLQFAVYVLVARNLFNGGSWVRRIFAGKAG